MAVSIEQTVATLRARASAQRAAMNGFAASLRDRLHARVPSELPSGVRAWLLGSLAWGGFGERSDVDLAVLGADASFASALELRLTRDLGVPVEVLRLEELPTSFRARIEREGVEFHGS